MTNIYTAVKLSAPNTTYGNPRRLWVVSEQASYESGGKHHHYFNRVDVIEEGYEGRAALFKKYPNAVEVMEVQVTASEYKRWVKVGENDRKLRLEAANEGGTN